MNTGQPNRTELIIGMTLAEVFLLLLCVVWWGVSAESRSKPPTPAEAERDRLRREVEQLASRNRDLERNLRERDDRIEALRRMLDARGTGIQDFKDGLDRKLAEARRGSPKCEPENVLLDVTVENEILRAVAVGGSDEAWSNLKKFGADEVKRGTVISDRVVISRLLFAIQQYYRSRSECRFDYRLTYNTAEDYHDARSLFEKYLYPAGIVRKEP